MRKPSKKALHKLGENLNIEVQFLSACLDASIIEVYETKGRIDLDNGTALRLRRLQRICLTFDVDLHVALILFANAS